MITHVIRFLRFTKFRISSAWSSRSAKSFSRYRLNRLAAAKALANDIAHIRLPAQRAVGVGADEGNAASLSKIDESRLIKLLSINLGIVDQLSFPMHYS